MTRDNFSFYRILELISDQNIEIIYQIIYICVCARMVVSCGTKRHRFCADDIG